jgi:glycosyltransferase involved in cell wall biosynthesis
MARSLYICYFGVREPLVQTQVVPYLRELASQGHQISLLTFDTKEAKKAVSDDEIERQLADQGIEWNSLRYHKRFSVLATTWDLLIGAIFVNGYIRKSEPHILHGRAHVATLIGAVARKFASRKPKLLFDIRGFMPEEYTDARIWPENGLLYRLSKRVEKWLMKEADGFIVLTEKARAIHFIESKTTGFDQAGRPVEVIPCCVDIDRFDRSAGKSQRAAVRKSLGVKEQLVMVYVGSFGGWYLTSEMLEFAKKVREIRPDVFFLILTQRDVQKAESMLVEKGFPAGSFLVTSASPTEIGKYLCASDFAISFIKPCYSKLASSPTKLAEYLAAGLPVVSNSGIGDVDELLKEERVGVCFDEFENESYRIAFEAVIKMRSEADLTERCQNAAAKHFDLEKVASIRYRRVYKDLLNGRN